MKLFTTSLNRNFKNGMYIAIGLIFLSFKSNAQFRTYGIVYSANIQGGVTMFGNTLMAKYNSAGTSVNTNAMNDNSANGNGTSGNDNSNMRYVDIDGNTGSGAETRNSSSSDLALPAGTNNIKLARLYWGGKAYKNDFDMTVDSNKTIKIKYGTGGYHTYAAANIDKHDTTISNQIRSQYQAYTDITAFIQVYGAGTYTIGNAAISQGTDSKNQTSYGGIYGGWCIVVVYENTDYFNYYNSVRVYDGFEQVYAGGAATTTSVTLTGLDVPAGPLNLEDARMGAMCWEGDANITGDSLRINNTYYSDAVNQLNNPWNGTISNDGVHVTTKNPNYTNQMGIDIDQFNVGTGYGIVGGASTVKLAFRTESDQYFPGLFTFQIKSKTPSVSLFKTVTDANNNHTADANEVLTYTISGKNIGTGNANNCIVTDTLPTSVTYVPGSIKYIYGPGNYNNIANLTDASDADSAEFNGSGDAKALKFRIGSGMASSSATGGILAANDSFKIQFQVTVNQPAQGLDVPPIINTARIVSFSDANVQSTNDATAQILGPQGGALPVILKSLFANLLTGNQVKLDWITSMEINTANFEIQRSVDGHNFATIGYRTAAGNSPKETSYTLTDNIAGINANTVYYRLKQVDIDGKTSVSKIVSVRLKSTAASLNISPNPFHSYLNVNVDWTKNEIAQVRVFNMTGTEVASKSVQMSIGTNYISIDEFSKLPSGNYVIQMDNQEGKMVKMVTKQ